MKISFSFLLFGKQPLTLVTLPRCVAMLILWKSMLVSSLFPVASVTLAPTSSMNLILEGPQDPNVSLAIGCTMYLCVSSW